MINLVGLISESARLHHDLVAVKIQDNTITYQELLDKGYKTIKRGSKNKPTCWNNTDVDYIGIRNKNIKEIKVYFPIDNDKNIISHHCIKGTLFLIPVI